MPVTIETMNARRAALQQQLALLAEPLAGNCAKLRGLTQLQIQASHETREANRWVLQNQARHDQLQVRVDRIDRMLQAPTRIGQAEEAVKTAQGMVASAEQAAEAAQKALSTIDSMIKAEQAAFEVARTAAASSLLATIKAGRDAAEVATPNLDKVATLELARVDARAERDATAAALAAATQRHQAAVRSLEAAKAGATELAAEIALDAFVDALVAHRRQCVWGRVDPNTIPFNLAQVLADREAGAASGLDRF